MNAQHQLRISTFLGALAVLVLAAGCVPEEQGRPATEQTATQALNEDVGTRGVAQAAPPQGAQLPTWPQRFEVRGPETASFGFAVTQPGPIVVDVQWQGPPLRVALEGPNRLEQIGAGRVVLKSHITPQDVQQGASLWSVSIALQNPGPTPAVGQIGVQHPQVNEMAARRAAEARRQGVTQQQHDEMQAQTEARLKKAIASRKAQFTQDLERRDRVERDKIQPMLTQLRASRQPLVRPRGLEAEKGDATAQSKSEISTRGAAESLGTSKTAERMAAIVQERSKLSVESAPAPQGPPHISSLSETSGGPRKVLLIRGTGFSDVRGQVYFTAPPDRALPANVVEWTDAGIIVELPDVTGVLPYQANIYVARGQELSNRVIFNFIPRQQLRNIETNMYFARSPGNPDYRTSSSFLTSSGYRVSDTFVHSRHPIPFGEFFGDKGNDEFFLRTQLKNGWTVSGAEIFPWPGLGGAYVQEQGAGTNPYLNIRWWINPFAPFISYRYVIHIVGPDGVPDGVVVP